VSPDGIRTVAEQEFTIRLRAGRWRWLLGAWFGVLTVVTFLIRLATQTVDSGRATDKGVPVYGGLTLLVLGLALLVVPTLSAQSVNGDRERGTLATLQVTRLTAGDIAVGKFAAAWGTSLVFVALTLPLVLFTMTQGGVTLDRVVVVTFVVAMLLGSVIAIALMLSSLLTRTTTSGVIAYLVVFALTIGTTVTFFLSLLLSQEDYTQTYGSEVYTGKRTRPDHVWWILAPNPFVILADAAPRLPEETAAEKAKRKDLEDKGIYVTSMRDSDPLGGLGSAVRSAHKHPDDPGDGKPVWPWGLAFDIALGAGALRITALRLQTPSRDLPLGQRVA
jgi:ABC-type transport system involved in multi-copper enzyme maturation permease subunit